MLVQSLPCATARGLTAADHDAWGNDQDIEQRAAVGVGGAWALQSGKYGG